MNLLAVRETQVANLVAEGLATKEIAKKLNITEHTVSNYLFKIYNKLGISSRVELVLYFMKHGEEREVAASGPMAFDPGKVYREVGPCTRNAPAS